MKTGICLILAQCVCAVSGFQSVPVQDSEIVSYWDEFQQDASKHGLALDASQFEMSFNWTQDDTDALKAYPDSIAFCQEASKRIIVRREYWQRLDYWGKRLVLRHEFGHCFLNLEHTDSVKSANDSKRVKKQIMSAYLMDAKQYKAKASQYDAQLFSVSIRGIAASSQIETKK